MILFQPSAKLSEHLRSIVNAGKIDTCFQKGDRDSTGPTSKFEYFSGERFGLIQPEGEIELRVDIVVVQICNAVIIDGLESVAVHRCITSIAPFRPT